MRRLGMLLLACGIGFAASLPAAACPLAAGSSYGYQAQIVTPVVTPVIAVPVLVPTYSVSYTPAPAAPQPKADPAPAAPNDLKAELDRLKAEVERLKRGQAPAPPAMPKAAEVAPAPPSKGAAVFQGKCLACHGADAAQKGGGLALTGALAPKDFKAALRDVRSGRMPKGEKLSPADREALLDFLTE